MVTEPPALSGAFPRRRPKAHPPTEEELDAAQQVYDAHSPSLVTYVCVAEGCNERWPCARYRAAEADLILAGRLQPRPITPS